jgi:hypothetical protein
MRCYRRNRMSDMSDRPSTMKPSQIAAAKLKVAIADRKGEAVPSWIRELAAREIPSSMSQDEDVHEGRESADEVGTSHIHSPDPGGRVIFLDRFALDRFARGDGGLVIVQQPPADDEHRPPAVEAALGAEILRQARPYADAIYTRLRALASDDIPNPTGTQLFPDDPYGRDAQTWDRYADELTDIERIWLIASLQARVAQRDQESSTGNTA